MGYAHGGQPATTFSLEGNEVAGVTSSDDDTVIRHVIDHLRLHA